MEIGQPFLEPRFGPQLLVLLQPLFRGDVQGRPRVEFVHKRAGGFATLLEDFRVAGLDLALGFGVDGPIAERRTVIRRALEDRQMADFLGDLRDELDSGGAGADDRHPLAGQVHALLRPSAGVKRVALEAVDALRSPGCNTPTDTNRRDQKLRPRPLAILQVDLPAIPRPRRRRPRSRAH